MKVEKVSINNRRKEFSITTRSGAAYTFPYTEADPCPGSGNRIEEVFVDKELGNEAITYVLSSGDEGSIHHRADSGVQRGPQLHGRTSDLQTYPRSPSWN